jgi:transmembrane sensor
MKKRLTSPSADSTAANWVTRQDRGLSPEEQDQLSQWLAENPRHRAALAEHRWGWDELDRLAGLQTSLGALPDPHLLAPPRRRRLGPAAVVPLFFALAAAIAVVLWPRFTAEQTSASRTQLASESALLALVEQRTLLDGSQVELNRGAAISVAFTATERRVRLERGEAYFSVAHDDLRPFVVEVAGVAVRAVGTAFTVALEPSAVAVLVTEGKVRVDPATTSAGPTELPILGAGQRAVIAVRTSSAALVVTEVDEREMAERLAWKPRLLDFEERALADIAAEFNRHNPVRLILAHPDLATRKLSGTFRSDNVEGFVRLMESDFGMRAEHGSGNEIVLRPGR